MLSENELVIELGNQLLRLYRKNSIQSITGLGRKSLADFQVEIAGALGLPERVLPSEESLRRAFRENQYSEAFLEKMALFYYAAVDEAVKTKAKGEFYAIANSKGNHLFNYWNRFVTEMQGAPVTQDEYEAAKKLDAAQKQMQQNSDLLTQALREAQKQDELIRQQYELIQQQRIASESRIRQLEDEVKKIIGTKTIENDTWVRAEKLFAQRNYIAYQHTLDEVLQNSLEQMAETHYLKAKGYEATLQYQHALENYQKASELQPQNPLYIYGLGHFLYLIAKYDSAIEVIKQALKIIEQDAQHKKLLGTALISIGMSYYEKDNFEIATGYFEQALEANLSFYGPASKYTAHAYNCLGLAYMDMAQFNKAIENYRKAYFIYEDKYGMNHPDMANILNHWGLALRNIDDFDGAIKNFRQALQIDEGVFGRRHPNVANYLNNIGEVWRHQSKYPDAIKCYEEAIEIYSSIFTNGHPRIAGFLNNLGAAIKEGGNPGKGIELYTQSMELNKKLFGENHTSIGSNYNNMGLAYHEMGSNELALANYQNALKVYSNIYQGDHPDIARVNGNMGGVFHSLEKFDEAIQWYDSAIDMYSRFFNPGHVATAFPIANKARVYDAQGNYDKAIEEYEKAGELFKGAYGDFNISLAHIYNNLGQTWNAKNNSSRAIENYEKAIIIFEKIVAPDNQFLVKCREELNQVKEKRAK